MTDEDRPECTIPRCNARATRELHFSSLDVWMPYCGDHTPLERSDDERPIEGATCRRGSR